MLLQYIASLMTEGEGDGTGDGVVDASTEEDGAVFIEADDGVAGEAGTEAAEGVLSTTALKDINTTTLLLHTP